MTSVFKADNIAVISGGANGIGLALATKCVEYGMKAVIVKKTLLALNAGIGLQGTWSDPAYFQKIMGVNLFGVKNNISALPPLVTDFSSKESPASIIITGSKQGITNLPGNPAYSAPKFAVKTVVEHLSFDLSKSSSCPSLQLLVPGWMFTGLRGNLPGKFYVICPGNDVSEDTDKNDMVDGERCGPG
ncbi:short-chain dehydrogenase/reductase [Calycina marina]|uniref:Short-chain dehydrogenase/reductase n=1 Tax=Calycina marina TaxID=1763456 RepID=A0A9P7Z1C4_9HELO|nr:short-chain dehydrogenase/reductase [Calycina marina]